MGDVDKWVNERHAFVSYSYHPKNFKDALKQSLHKLRVIAIKRILIGEIIFIPV